MEVREDGREGWGWRGERWNHSIGRSVCREEGGENGQGGSLPPKQSSFSSKEINYIMTS